MIPSELPTIHTTGGTVLDLTILDTTWRKFTPIYTQHFNCPFSADMEIA